MADMDLVKFRNSLTQSPGMGGPAVAPPMPPPSLEGGSLGAHISPSALGKSSQQGAHQVNGGPSLNVLRLGADVTAAGGIGEDDDSLLKLVEEVTKDEDHIPSASASLTPAGGPAGFGGSTSTHSHSLLPNYNQSASNLSVPRGSSSQRPSGGPPGYGEEISGAGGSFAGGNWSIGSPDRAHEGAGLPPPPPPPMFASSPEPGTAGAAPQFPQSGGQQGNSSITSAPPEFQAYNQRSAPPPPNGGAPPSFASAVASISKSGGSPLQGPAPPPPPPQGSQSGRVPETLIVRNEHGVFLLQPVSSTSPVAGPTPHGNSPTPGPAAPPGPPPSSQMRNGSISGQQPQQQPVGAVPPPPPGPPPPAYGSVKTPAQKPSNGSITSPPPHIGGTSPIPGANSSRSGPPAYNESPVAPGGGLPPPPPPLSQQPGGGGGSSSMPPPYALPPPGSAPLIGSPQANPGAAEGGVAGGPPPPPPGGAPPPYLSGKR